MTEVKPPVKRRRPKRRLKKFSKSLMQNQVSVAFLSRLAIWYLKFVVKTNRLVVEPANILDNVYYTRHIHIP